VGLSAPLGSARLFERREEKYEIDRASRRVLEAAIAERLPRFNYLQGQPYTFVTTAYFDTSDRDFYRWAEAHYEDNVKIRVKEYYYLAHPERGSPQDDKSFPDEKGRSSLEMGASTENGPSDMRGLEKGAAAGGNGTGKPAIGSAARLVGRGAHAAPWEPAQWEASPKDLALREEGGFLTFDHCFVELKQRANGSVVKKRFAFPKAQLSHLFGGQDVWQILLEITPPSELGPLRVAYGDLRRYLARYPVEVTSIVNYRRTVYQRDESDLRITFDDRIAIYTPIAGLYGERRALTAEALGRPLRTSERVILEIKCPGEYPDWLKGSLRPHSAERLSKFTTSVRLILSDTAWPAIDRNANPEGKAPLDAGGTSTRGGGVSGGGVAGSTVPGGNGTGPKS